MKRLLAILLITMAVPALADDATATAPSQTRPDIPAIESATDIFDLLPVENQPTETKLIDDDWLDFEGVKAASLIRKKHVKIRGDLRVNFKRVNEKEWSIGYTISLTAGAIGKYEVFASFGWSATGNKDMIERIKSASTGRPPSDFMPWLIPNVTVETIIKSVEFKKNGFDGITIEFTHDNPSINSVIPTTAPSKP